MSSADALVAIVRCATEYGLGCSESELLQAESSYGRSIPVDYRDFLVKVGWARIGSQEIYGLGSDAPVFMNIVETARWEIENGVLPKHLVPLHPDGGGNYTCIDLREDPPVRFVK